MSLLRRFIFVSLICASPVFADWVLPVKHECISLITIERNVVSVFWKGMYGHLAMTVGDRISANSPLLFRFISIEHDDHEAIDHHNVQGRRGRMAEHTHVAFENINHVPLAVLNQVLLALEFETAERTRIMLDYQRYFEQNKPAQTGLSPLTPDTRVQHTPPLERAINPPDLTTNMVPRALVVMMMVYFAIHLGGYYSNAL